MDYQKTAKALVNTIGRDNITGLTHCATRLRFSVKDKQIDEVLVEAIQGVNGQLYLNDQYQVFVDLGAINEIYDAVLALLQA